VSCGLQTAQQTRVHQDGTLKMHIGCHAPGLLPQTTAQYSAISLLLVSPIRNSIIVMSSLSLRISIWLLHQLAKAGDRSRPPVNKPPPLPLPEPDAFWPGAAAVAAAADWGPATAALFGLRTAEASAAEEAPPAGCLTAGECAAALPAAPAAAERAATVAEAAADCCVKGGGDLMEFVAPALAQGPATAGGATAGGALGRGPAAACAAATAALGSGTGACCCAAADLLVAVLAVPVDAAE